MLQRKEILLILDHLADTMAENKQKLIEMDSIVGDGDLGLTMSDGFATAAKAAGESSETDIGKLFYLAGKSMSTAVPSTMGTLMAYGLMNVGKALKGKLELAPASFGDVWEAYEQGVMNLGKAKLGDKTFLDGLHPAIEAFRQTEAVTDGFHMAAKAAMDGAVSTTTLLAVHGRAASRGEASRTLLDPGAYVAALIVQSISDTIISLLS